jgi:hypothetical protein
LVFAGVAIATVPPLPLEPEEDPLAAAFVDEPDEPDEPVELLELLDPHAASPTISVSVATLVPSRLNLLCICSSPVVGGRYEGAPRP